MNALNTFILQNGITSKKIDGKIVLSYKDTEIPLDSKHGDVLIKRISTKLGLDFWFTRNTLAMIADPNRYEDLLKSYGFDTKSL